MTNSCTQQLIVIFQDSTDCRPLAMHLWESVDRQSLTALSIPWDHTICTEAFHRQVTLPPSCFLLSVLTHDLYLFCFCLSSYLNICLAISMCIWFSMSTLYILLSFFQVRHTVWIELFTSDFKCVLVLLLGITSVGTDLGTQKVKLQLT